MTKLQALLEKYQQMSIYDSLVLTNLDDCGEQDSPIHWACYEGNLSDLKEMLVIGVNVNAKGDIGDTPLHQAALKGHLSIVKLLLEAGADITAVNDYGDTVQDFAKSSGNQDLIEFISKFNK
jgi:ankyrin repeat protein